VSWKKNVGDLVEADEAIASIQTDKAELDWSVTDDVYLAAILLEPGETVKCGTPACIFVENKADVAAFANYKGGDAPAAPAAPSTPEPPKPAASTPAAPVGSDPSKFPEHKVEGMPALSPTAVDGAVVEWLVKEGDKVEEGSGIAEIQTDKSVVTWTALDDAYVAKLLVKADPDAKVTVGEPLAVFVDDEKDVAAFKDFTVGGAAPAAPTSAPAASTESAAPSPPTPSGRTPSIQFRHGVRDTPQTASKTSSVASTGGRVSASPYAKKLAAEMGVDLNSVGSASGNRGRVIAVDVMKAAQEKPASTEKSSSIATPAKPVTLSGDRTYEDIPVSAMREIIGKRLSESMFTSPHFYVTMECMMDSLMAMRAEINSGEEKQDFISVNDFIIKACGAALRDTPDCNVGWIQQPNSKPVMRKYNYVDISVAVATPTGLITPIIKDVDRKGLRDISLEMKDLAKRAKANKLLPEEFQGGTFTISNMGMFGVNNFTAIINPPQACILAVGGAKKKIVPDEKDAKGFKAATTMEVTLSSDHRSVDGALAAIWVNAFQKYIQQPSKLML